MMNFSKKIVMLSCLFMVFVADAEIKKTKKLQGLVIPTDPSYFFALNAGDGIQTNPGGIRPLGAYYETSFLLFPGDTIDLSQTDFSVDRHGHPINPNNNIGIGYAIEHMVQTLDFVNIPPSGTVMEISSLTFLFKDTCDGVNIITASGITEIKTFPPQLGKPIFKFYSGVTGATGCNEDRTENKLKAKIFLPESGPLVIALVDIEFEEEIEYKD